MSKLTFAGGIHPYDGKDLSKAIPIKEIAPVSNLVYPLSQHIGAPAKPIVSVGDRGLPKLTDLCRHTFILPYRVRSRPLRSEEF